jgi:hypothetical protein
MTIDYAQRLELSGFLKTLASGQPSCSVAGICSNVEEYFFETGIDRWFNEAIQSGVFSGWVHYSGSKLFPVPDPRRAGSDNAHHAYWQCKSHWSRRTKYGRLRRDLALWTSDVVLTWENPGEQQELEYET